MDPAGQGFCSKFGHIFSAVALNLPIALALSEIAEDQEGCLAELWDESVYRVTQILLDLLINANRVFEIDDLWTNTLGGYLAWRAFQLGQKIWKNRQDDAFKRN